MTIFDAIFKCLETESLKPSDGKCRKCASSFTLHCNNVNWQDEIGNQDTFNPIIIPTICGVCQDSAFLGHWFKVQEIEHEEMVTADIDQRLRQQMDDNLRKVFCD